MKLRMKLKHQVVAVAKDMPTSRCVTGKHSAEYTGTVDDFGPIPRPGAIRDDQSMVTAGHTEDESSYEQVDPGVCNAFPDRGDGSDGT